MVLGGCCHAGPQRIGLDVAGAGQDIGLAVDYGRLIAPFPQGAAAAIAVVDVADIAPPRDCNSFGNAVVRPAVSNR